MEQLKKSKSFVSKSGTIYPSPEAIIKPMKALIKGEHYIQATASNSNANVDKTINLAYDRFSLISKIKIDEQINFEIGILVAFDLKNPTIKCFYGTRVNSCLNLSVFTEKGIVKTSLLDSTDNIIKEIETNFGNVKELIKGETEKIESMKKTVFNESQFRELIGRMIIKHQSLPSSSGINSILSGVSELANPKSKYFFSKQNNSLWNIYNSFTEYNSQKVHFFDQPEKALNLYTMLN